MESYRDFAREDLMRALRDYETASLGSDDEKQRLLYDLPLHQIATSQSPRSQPGRIDAAILAAHASRTLSDEKAAVAARPRSSEPTGG